MVKSIKIEQNLLKNGQIHDAKNNRSEHFVSQWTDIIHSHCRFNEGGIKLLFLINNYIWINLVSTRHLRPWYANYKMSVDDSRQKIGRNTYLQGTVMHRKMHRKVQNVAKITPFTNDNILLTLLFNVSNNFMFFLMRQTLGRQTMAKYLRNAWSQESKFRWPSFILFRQNWSRDTNLKFLS